MILSLPLLLAAALPGTEALTREGDLALRMVQGIDAYLDRRLRTAQAQAPGSIERFRRIIGVVDAREPKPVLEKLGERMGHAAAQVHRVRWPVFEGVDGEGLYLEPTATARCAWIVIPDADQTPEEAAGQYGWPLAASGCRVLIPYLIDRSDEWSGNPAVRMTNQTHREYIYRMAYQTGRHIIGYEVQKVLAAIDAMGTNVSMMGYGEGGLIAFHSAVCDERIERVFVSGYFRDRRHIHSEPIYRNVWGLLPSYGDAELARMISPRQVVVHPAAHPESKGPPAVRTGRSGAAPGAIATPGIDEVRAEVARARGAQIHLLADGSIATLLRAMIPNGPARVNAATLPVSGSERAKRQFRQLVEYTQKKVRQAEADRRAYWKQADLSTPERWLKTQAPYLRAYAEDFIGRLPAGAPGSVETRKIYDEHLYEGYEVYLPVLDEVFAYGILLIPKGMRAGEKRPLVIAQHGLEGRPQDLIQPSKPGQMQTYQRFAARLAERGFIVYAPQNPYIHGAAFRQLSRKSAPLQLGLFAFVTAQYARTLDWLETLPYVDRDRIGFYGLSYGGTTALRVPPLEPRIKVIVCSGNFNEWSWKITTEEQGFSYMLTGEYEIYEFNQTAAFGHAEMVTLMAPRPFFVERGHHDGVGMDEWVSYEYAKVRRLYADWGRSGETGIEYFNGIHQIWGNEAFSFLHRHLRWP
jgi:dienelactone hydrolase